MLKHSTSGLAFEIDGESAPPDIGLRIATNGVDFVIAEDLRQAREIVAKQHGYEVAADFDDEDAEIDDVDGHGGWTAYQDRDEFTMSGDMQAVRAFLQANDFPETARIKVKATSKEWADKLGASYLASTEY